MTRFMLEIPAGEGYGQWDDDRIWAELEQRLAAAGRPAIRRGEVPASVDPVSRAKGLVATSQGLMVVGKANPDEEVLRIIVDNAFARLM